MIHDKMYELNCPFGIHHICDMTLTCNGASHCICVTPRNLYRYKLGKIIMTGICIGISYGK